jgi:DNA-binding IclR family transcriptional regulator
MSADRVEAVERALAILEAFADGTRAMTLTELARRTGFYKSTLLRLAASLDRFGYLSRDEAGLFRLGPSLWRLGSLYAQAFDLAEHVRPVLVRLVAETGETAAFYVREGDARICLYRHNASRMIGHHVEEGAQLPLDRGGSARVLMAFTGEAGALYDQVRAAGYYISLGERDPDTAAVAVPVFGMSDRFVGALGVTGLKTRFDEPARAAILQLTLTAAEALGRALGGSQRRPAP